ncbi:MAG: MBL fold metallo-hydrolase [Treponema sp.]|nr:MBL fold metallo-hydrolase [Candidatus Treponema caballi]
MYMQFWGVRGSLPTPLTPQQIRSKISAVVQRIGPDDIKDADSRQRFIDTLPETINGTVGGNTACVELVNKKGTVFILDAGSGLRALGKKYGGANPRTYHILFSHFHWDHIQGLPFFDPIFNPKTEIHIYSPVENVKQLLSDQMEAPYFPVPLSACTKNIFFHIIKPMEPFEIDGTIIECKRMHHPGGSYSYLFKEDDHKIVYATDVELQPDDYKKGNPNYQFFGNADVLILDAQYTVEEVIAKENWGHSSFSHATDFATSMNVKKLFLFHHDPVYDDKKIHTILKTADWYMNHNRKVRTEVSVASEGMEITL